LTPLLRAVRINSFLKKFIKIVICYEKNISH
jgi:hypothetical protein